MGRVVWYNGSFIPESEAKVSIYDSAMMFGDCIFDMLRTFNCHIFKLEEHIDRLLIGLKILDIKISWSRAELISAVLDTIVENDKIELFKIGDEHRILIDVTRGLLGLYQGVADVPKGPNVWIADFPLRWTTRGMGKLFDSGINAVIPNQTTIPFYLLDQRIKNRNRIHFVRANLEVSKYKGDNNWALLLDPDGYIAEGCGDNFFIVDKNDTVITPEGRNILRGISRQYIFELCDDLGIEWIEKNITPYDVYESKEAFFTATPFCVIPIVSLNSIPIGEGKVKNDRDSIFFCLLEEWGQNVQVNIKRQIQKWDEENDSKITGLTPYSFNEGDKK
jgi:branched-chain amino acid aminotransferase